MPNRSSQKKGKKKKEAFPGPQGRQVLLQPRTMEHTARWVAPHTSCSMLVIHTTQSILHDARPADDNGDMLRAAPSTKPDIDSSVFRASPSSKLSCKCYSVRRGQCCFCCRA